MTVARFLGTGASIGGAWSVIPGNATVEGPPSPLQVLTSKNRLHSN